MHISINVPAYATRNGENRYQIDQRDARRAESCIFLAEGENEMAASDCSALNLLATH